MGNMATPDDCAQLALRNKEIWIGNHLGFKKYWKT